jgi:hypothetical protein
LHSLQSRTQLRIEDPVVGLRKLEHLEIKFFTAVTMKNAVLWEVAPCGSCSNRSFERTRRLYLRSRKNPRVKKCVRSG